MNILVVDDSAMIRNLVKRAISMSGLTVEKVFEAGNGVEAITVLAKEKVHALITDINMPSMSGEELVRAVRGDPQLAKLPVLVVSTETSDARKKVMTDLGVSGFLGKPFKPEQLKATLDAALRG